MQTNVPHPLGKEEFKAFLKKLDMKATPQRMAVHDAMAALVHASADMVVKHIAANSGIRVTQASVYNTLMDFSAAGLYARRLSSDSRMYFDACPEPHIHLYDTAGSVYKDVIDAELMTMVHERLGRKKFKGVRIDGIDIQILCHPTRKYTRKKKEP